MSQANEQTESADRPLASPPLPPSTHTRALGQVALLVTITVAAYLPAMQGDFLWDDSAHVPRPHLRSLSGLARIWFEPSASQQYYPVSNTFYWIQHRLWGDETLGYHLVNVLLHAANACLVLGILRKLNIPGALLAAAIFAVHPVHVESVAWISEQKNTLSALFYLSAVWLYLDFDTTRQPASYWGSFSLFVLGLLSKSVIASLPAALLLIFWWRRGTLSWRRDWTPLLPFFVVGACAGLFTAWLERTQVGADGGEFDLSFVERFLLASRVPWFYAWKLVWPTNLMFVYPRWTIDATSGEQWIYPIVTFAVLGALVVAAWRWNCRGTLAGVLFFLGTLFPVLGFLNVYPFRFSYVADHFQYLASLGLIVLAAAGLTLTAARMPQQIQPATKVAGALLVGLLAWLTWQQSHIYGDVVTLYRTTLARNPNAWMAHSNLGVELADGMRVDEAIQHYHEALRLKPDAAEVHFNLANAFVAKDKRVEAITAYREALRYEPEYPQALGNLGSILAEQGQLEEAIRLLETAIRVTPYDPGAHDRLGDMLMNAGRTGEAAPHFAEEQYVARTLGVGESVRSDRRGAASRRPGTHKSVRSQQSGRGIGASRALSGGDHSSPRIDAARSDQRAGFRQSRGILRFDRPHGRRAGRRAQSDRSGPRRQRPAADDPSRRFIEATRKRRRRTPGRQHRRFRTHHLRSRAQRINQLLLESPRFP